MDWCTCGVLGVNEVELLAPAEEEKSFHVEDKNETVALEPEVHRGHPYFVKVIKQGDRRFGASIMTCYDSSLIIQGIAKVGVLPTWNSTASPDLRIEVGDRIDRVNGVTPHDDKVKVLAELRNSDELEISLTRPAESWISCKEEPHGLEFDSNVRPNASTLPIKRINKGGVHTWNENNTSEPVCANDHIVQVNGVLGCAQELKDAMGASSKCDLFIRRYS